MIVIYFTSKVKVAHTSIRRNRKNSRNVIVTALFQFKGSCMCLFSDILSSVMKIDKLTTQWVDFDITSSGTLLFIMIQ